MVSVDLHAISDLLDEALDLEGSAREPWLAHLARTEPGLASTLRALLSRQGELETDQLLIDGGRALGSAALANAIDGRTDASMASAAPESREYTPQFILQSGTTIGPYRLIKPLGEGGMASVWLAERIDGQLKREVALKLLHAWRNSRELVERFARERDMLAGLVHPNIARLYDAGVTANGQPWIALEYVEGLDFAAYADQNALSIRQRVESILQVMAAVQYAHQNLIVHRDLKPTNILVNKKGEVRLLDFGIAKLLQQENVSAAETELTRNSGRALTLRYAAPEQIEGKPITTATDVYALGLVLYELLTGASARDGKHHKKKIKKNSGATSEKTNTQAEREALTTDIMRPSRGPIDKKIADVRGHVTPAEIKSTLSGDLDTIVLKALSREPARRYPTVSAFAADLTAWLERRPITARAPSFAYAMRMFVSRQRVPVAVGCIVLVAVSASGMFAWKQRIHANQQSARAEQVQTFMANLLSDAEPEGVEGEKALTAKSLLDAGVDRVHLDYRMQPVIQAETLTELARVYIRIGESAIGEKLLLEAIGLIEKNAAVGEPSLQAARSHLGAQLIAKGEWQNGTDKLNGVLADCKSNEPICEKARGIAHLNLAFSPTINDEQKRGHLRTARELFDKHDSSSKEKLKALTVSADFERARGNFDLANVLVSQVERDFSHANPKLVERGTLGILQSNLAFDSGDFFRAAEIIDRTLANFENSKREGAKLYFHVSRAHVANYQGLTSKALLHADEAKKLSVRLDSSIYLAYALRYEARALSMSGEYSRATKSVDEAFAVLRKKNIAETSETWLDIVRADGEVRARKGDFTGSRRILEEMLVTLRAKHPIPFKDQANTLDLAGAVSLAMGDTSAALAFHLEEIELLKAHLPANHPLRLRAELQATRARYVKEGKSSQVSEMLALAKQLKQFVPDDSVHARTLSELVSGEGSNDSSTKGGQQRLMLIF
jgi:eukaryotic-like serine/threonine-protein kinase